MFLKKAYIVLVLLLVVASGCSKYQKLLKSGDNQAKYAAAMDLYEAQDYYRALQLFQQLLNFYQGTEEGRKMQFYHAYCYYHQRDYILASYYFKRFATTYPRSEEAEEARFLGAYCYFLDSPKASLDQTNTYTAINELSLFIDMYPYSDRIERCRELILQLQDKLMLKDYNIANLYFKMEDYEAAIASYNNLLKDYPDTEFKEQVLFRILKSNYQFASKSIEKKKDERYQGALDSYNELIFQYPETSFKREAQNIYRNIMKEVSVEDQSSTN